MSSARTLLPSSITQSATIATVTSIPVANITINDSIIAASDSGECRLLGPFALFIQGALGFLALLSLVYKRWRERPQRPVKIWAFDASKQVVGSALLHIANLFMSMVSSGELKPKAGDFEANPCSFYLLNLAIDVGVSQPTRQSYSLIHLQTTIGIPILVFLLHLLTRAFSLTPLANPPESIESGNYGHPPKSKWWLKQCLIYFIGLLGMKFCVYLIFQLCPWIVQIGNWALRWTEGNESVQIFFVMLFFPLVMNAIQYYIIDSFIKDKKAEDHEQIPDDDEGESDGDGEGRHRRRSVGELEDEGSLDEIDEAEAVKESVDVDTREDTKLLDKPPQKKDRGPNREDYDPALDGEDGEASTSPTGSGTSLKNTDMENHNRNKLSS